LPKLQWKQIARDDLWAIIAHIAEDNPDAGENLQNEILSKVAKLAENPLIYRAGTAPGTRELTIRKNYIVIYSVTDEEVVILRIAHAAQDRERINIK
jgi:addiction module RelE/StbE family toxin